jgi:hypothetical protein
VRNHSAFGGKVALLACSLSTSALAQSYMLPATDARLRADVALLVDEGVFSLPTNAWPIPAGDVVHALERVRADQVDEPALNAAISRLRAKLVQPEDAGEWRLRSVNVAAGKASALRSYDTVGRDAFELGSTGGTQSDRWSLQLTTTAVGSPDDGRHLRLDGSELSIRWGNWLFSANQIARWWGPGWDGGLILSTNARPMPALSIDRVRSDPFDFPVLRWLGPWRFSAFLGRAQKYRSDVDESLFLGMRASFKPVPIVEVGLSRTAQFCGKGRPCSATTFKDVLLGNDNAGLRVAPEDEPGNQMAGIDLRVVSPWRSLPIAIYTQLIGEDNSSSGIPERYLGQFGAEMWILRDTGDLLRGRIEYADTSCKFSSPNENPDCAYHQGIFRAGYRFHGRNIGHTTDGDSESVGLSLTWTRPAGTEWGLHLRRATLDRYGGPDPFNELTQGSSDFSSAQISWAGQLLGQGITAQLGYQRLAPSTGGASDQGAFGFLGWRMKL